MKKSSHLESPEGLESEEEILRYVERPQRISRRICAAAFPVCIVGLLIFGGGPGVRGVVGTVFGLGGILSFGGWLFLTINLREGRRELLDKLETSEELRRNIEDDA
jgi:hypothetical protein